MEFLPGCSFWIIPDRHLYFAITDTLKFPDEVLIVNLTSYDQAAPPGVYNDPACIIQVGEHPFVQHTSCICYNAAQLSNISYLSRKLTSGELSMGKPASDDLLQRMRNCAGNSIYMEIGFYKVLEIQGLDSSDAA